MRKSALIEKQHHYGNMYCAECSQDWYYEGNAREVVQRLSEEVHDHKKS